MTRPRSAAPRSCERAGIADVVLRVPGREHGRRLLIAVLVASGVHGALWRWSQWRVRPRAAAEVGARLPVPPTRDLDIDVLDPPSPPPPLPPAEERTTILDPAKSRARLPPPPRSPPSHAATPGRATPAAAGSILAQQPDPDAPVDLTGETFVTGTASAYAGGVTASNGTNHVAVSARDVDPRTPPGARTSASSHASAVSLADQTWSCPWPREADAEQIDQQTVVIRVIVTADGNVESAKVLSDPGHGFGAAATACALRTRFTPASDHQGHPIRAPSPPIRVTFTR